MRESVASLNRVEKGKSCGKEPGFATWNGYQLLNQASKVIFRLTDARVRISSFLLAERRARWLIGESGMRESRASARRERRQTVARRITGSLAVFANSL